MTEKILEKLTLEVCELVKETGKFLASEINLLNMNDIETKGLHDFVTRVDKASEKMLITGLRKILPDAGFIAEESPGLKPNEKYNWIIDPLDGTTNYIHGIPLFSISIGLTKGSEIIAGVVYEINSNECFYAWEGSPAFLNGKMISVSQRAEINQGLFATGFPYHDFSKLDPYLGFFKYLIQQSHGVRRLGSAAVDLAWVACGRFEGFYEYGLNPWDVAAGAIIVQQAGGKVSDFSGNRNYLFGKEIVATNGFVHNNFMDALKVFFA